MQRLIARFDIKNGFVIKGIHLEGQRKIGDPVLLARKYYEEGIDEILLMDSVASLYGRSNLFNTLVEACRQVFVPITIGGGVRTIKDVECALAAGADKVAINTALISHKELAPAITRVYGRQSLVASIEAKRCGDWWQAYVNNGRDPTGLNVIEWAQELEDTGVGEILVTSIDKEGTQRGFDIELYKAIQSRVSIPITASGGAGKVDHLRDLSNVCVVQGVAIASLLHYNKASVSELKTGLPFSINR